MSSVATTIVISAIDSTNSTEEALALSDMEQVILAILADNKLTNTTVVSPLTGEPIYTPIYVPPRPVEDGPLKGVLIVSPRSMFATMKAFEPDYPLFDEIDYHS